MIMSARNPLQERSLMKNRLILFWIAALMLIGLAACAPAAQPVEATEVVAVSQPAPETAPVTEEAVPAEEMGADACVDCHTDKDMLIETAAPVVEEEKESSGAG
jgi:mono/diheme cytochrome c family protein